MIAFVKSQFKSVEKGRVITYVLIYFIAGLVMNYVGQVLEIAKFTYWWQVITVYVLYMVPVSIILRNFPFFTQYAYGMVAMGLLEFGGYALGSSYIYPGNIIDKILGPHVFALAMTLFFSFYFPVGNWVVSRIFATFRRKK